MLAPAFLRAQPRPAVLVFAARAVEEEELGTDREIDAD
jgi:hypothetical protein